MMIQPQIDFCSFRLVAINIALTHCYKLVSFLNLIFAVFLLKFSNFRCHGNRGWSSTNFNSTVKFIDPDNPLLGAGMGVVSPVQAKLLPIFC